MLALGSTAVRISKPEWERRSLDTHYYPDKLGDACDLIELLRTRLLELTTPPPDAHRHGMTPDCFLLYSFLKKKAGTVVTTDMLIALVCDSWDYRSPNLVSVHICRIRKRLPPNEKITTVRGVGFIWSSV